MCSSILMPDRCQSIRVCTAKRWRRSWMRGCTAWVRTPILVVISLNVVPRQLLCTAVPALERKNARERGRRVDRLRVAGKPGGSAPPLRPLVRMRPLRQPRPTDRQLAAERGSAGGLDVGDELPEQVPVLFELESQRAAQPQVVIDMR